MSIYTLDKNDDGPIKCPYCSQGHDISWEVSPVNGLYVAKCLGCGREFVFSGQTTYIVSRP